MSLDVANENAMSVFLLLPGRESWEVKAKVVHWQTDAGAAVYHLCMSRLLMSST